MRNLLVFLIAIVIFSCKDDDPAFTPDVSIPEIETPVDVTLDGRIPCEDGFAGLYPCDGYDLMAHFSKEDLSVAGGNDIWGWTDPNTLREYAIVGNRSQTTFIDITDPIDPQVIGFIPTPTSASNWQDIKVYKDHAFIVSEAGNHGMLVFDLTRLRDPQESPTTFEADARYTEFGSSHNIVINEDTGYAYVVGGNTFIGGPHFVNIQDPLNPIAAGGFDEAGYTHDAQVVTYSGPDDDYFGNEIFVGSNEDEVVIADVTDKENPFIISTVSQDNVGYTHQGWLDEDHTLFYANDEFDESEFGFNSRTLVFDLSDLDNPQYLGPFFGPTQAVDHNVYVKGDELYISNYTAGMRVADISQSPNLASIMDIGFFDTYIEDNDTKFSGVWSVYPYFNSGNIVISDISRGFFIVRKTGT